MMTGQKELGKKYFINIGLINLEKIKNRIFKIYEGISQKGIWEIKKKQEKEVEI